MREAIWEKIGPERGPSRRSFSARLFWRSGEARGGPCYRRGSGELTGDRGSTATSGRNSSGADHLWFHEGVIEEEEETAVLLRRSGELEEVHVLGEVDGGVGVFFFWWSGKERERGAAVVRARGVARVSPRRLECLKGRGGRWWL
jgi:hypothetical protein